MRALERYIIHSRMGAHDMDDNRIRAAQFLRGSVSTKMVASSAAIQSLQSVALSDLSESERSKFHAAEMEKERRNQYEKKKLTARKLASFATTSSASRLPKA